MNFGKYHNKNGFTGIAILVSMFLAAISLPVATKLVQQSQENRSNAAGPSTSSCSSTKVGNRTCSGSDAYQCKKVVTNIPGSGGVTNTSYNWTKEYDCKYGCSDGRCKCSTGSNKYDYGDKTCVNGDIQKCAGGEKGTWAKSTECGSVGCKTGTTKCNSSSSCSYNGKNYDDGEVTCIDNDIKKCNETKWSVKIDCKSPGCKVGSSSCYECSQDSDCSKSQKCSNHKCIAVSSNQPSVKKASCTAQGGSCMGGVKTCTEGEEGTVISNTDCQSPSPVCCKVTASSGQTIEAPTKTPTPTKKPTPTSPLCTSKGGTCVASGPGMVGGVKCTISSNLSGTTVLTYSCETSTKVCCIPNSTQVEGKCVNYNDTLTKLPDNKCAAGTVSWENGDQTGSDGTLNWKCKGIDGGATVDCQANYNPCLAGNGSCKTTCATGESIYSQGNSYCSPGKCCKKNPITPTTKQNREVCTKDAECQSGKCAITDSTKTRVCIPATGTVYVCDYYYDDAYSEKWIDGKVSGDGEKCGNGCNTTTGKCKTPSCNSTNLGTYTCQDNNNASLCVKENDRYLWKSQKCTEPEECAAGSGCIIQIKKLPNTVNCMLSENDCKNSLNCVWYSQYKNCGIKKEEGEWCNTDKECLNGYCNPKDYKCDIKSKTANQRANIVNCYEITSETECNKKPTCFYNKTSSCSPKADIDKYCSNNNECLTSYCGDNHQCANKPTPTPTPLSCSSKNGSCAKVGDCSYAKIITGVIGCTSETPICCRQDVLIQDDCLSQKGTCRTSCPEGEKLIGSTSCRPAVCCIPNTSEIVDGVCNSEFNDKTLTSRPADTKACSKGSVFWTNPSGLNFQYSWECRGINNGKTAKCSAQKTCTLGSKRCSSKTIQTCVSRNGTLDWKDGPTCSEDCDSGTFECKAKCKFNEISVTTDQMTINNVCTLGVPGNTLIKNGKVWTWTCGGEFYAEVNCSATDENGSFGNDCQEDKDCGSENKCVDNKCMKSGYCISTKITDTPQIWKGDICFNKTQYSCTNSGSNFWSFKQTNCKYKCQNNKCVDGYICANGWSEHYNPENKLVDSTQCGQGCDTTTGRCQGEAANIFKCVKAGIFRNEDWSEEYDSKNQKINSTHCYEGGCNQSTGKCTTAKDASVKSVQYPICESKGGICFGNIATCRNEGGTVVGGTDCKSPTVCCQIIDKTDGICNNPKINNGELPSTDKLCLNGTFSFVSYQNQKYTWQCLGSTNGGKTADCSTTVSNPKNTCDQQPIGAQKCQTPYISLKCTPKGWEPVYCNDFALGEYCLVNKCEKINTPKKEGDSCLDNVGEFKCPYDKNLTCLNHKCVPITKAEDVEKNKIKCTGTSYNLSTVYDSQTACPSGLSCNRRNGICETPEKIIAKKKANDFCKTDAECLTGYCMPVTSDVNAPQTCSDVTDREYVDKGNKSAAIIGGTILAPYAVAAASEIGVAGVVSAVTKIGNVADALEIIIGSIACAKDPNSAACRNLQDDIITGGIAPGSLTDIVDDIGDAFRATKTAESAATAAKEVQKGIGTVMATAEDGSQLISVGGVLIQGPSSYDIFDKWGVEYYPSVPEHSLYMLKSKIATDNPAVPSGNLNDLQKLWQYATGVNTNSLDLMSDYVAVEQSYLTKRFGMPDLQNIGGDTDKALSELTYYMNRNGVKRVKTSNELLLFDIENLSDSYGTFEREKNTNGFFSPKFPQTVFESPTNKSAATLPHELLHQAQYQEYLEFNRYGYAERSPSEIREFEAYIYALPLDFGRQSSKVKQSENFNETLSNALWGVQSSVKNFYGDATPNYLK